MMFVLEYYLIITCLMVTIRSAGLSRDGGFLITNPLRLDVMCKKAWNRLVTTIAETSRDLYIIIR